MTDLLHHRGPDGAGEYWQSTESGHGVALGHRRLAIIDVLGGRQPMCNEDESVWIVFNGEIYNYRELAKQLTACGHRFRTQSDTETILHLYEEKGDQFLEHLRGMFAFALWDDCRKRLILARDRLGKKPLVYRRDRGRLLFASELKSLLAVPGVPRRINPQSLNGYVSLHYVPQPQTIFAGCFKLPSAHYAVWQDDQFSLHRYWHPNFESNTGLSHASAREALMHELTEAVQLRLRSDVPLGVFLSGGIDSTVIAGLMQKDLANAAKTYTIGFPESRQDESLIARETARALKTDHHELLVRPDVMRVLPALAWHFDEPFGDSSAIPTYYVAQAARQHVKVALTGDGGDELFADYARYRLMQQLGRFDVLPLGLRRSACRLLQRLLPAPDRETSLLRRVHYCSTLIAQSADERFATCVAQIRRNVRENLFSPDFAALLGRDVGENPILRAIADCPPRSAGTRAMLADLQTYLPDDLLVKVDIASMAHGLECRNPFLDHHVVELAAQIPFDFKVRGRSTKTILKQTFADRLPGSVLSQRKQGFSIPIDRWFRSELKDLLHDVLLSPRSLGRGYFQARGVRRLIDQHHNREWNHGNRLWSLLMLELWHQTHFDRPTPEAPPQSANRATRTIAPATSVGSAVLSQTGAP